MSIVLCTLRCKRDQKLDVDMTCNDYGETVFLEQGGDLIELDNAQLQQLWEAIEAEMKRR